MSGALGAGFRKALEGSPATVHEKSQGVLLVVDDEPAIRASIADQLRGSYRVLTASGGAEALTLLREHPVAVLLTDQRMPGMTGAELLANAAQETPDVTRLLVTGYSELDAVVRSVNDGKVYHYLTKPWRPGELEAVIARAFEHNRLLRERRALTEELQRANSELELKVQVRTEELVRATRAAEQANRAKSEFLAVMSHEIRTPLNGIIGMTELALDTELSREQREYLETVKSSGDVLLGVINDILDFSKIEAGKLELDDVETDLRECLGDMLRSLALRAQSKGLELVADIQDAVPGVLLCDPARLRQVLVNLVGNAIKFTQAGEVVVSVGVASRTDTHAHLQISVIDTGAGIPADRLEAVFQPFEQAERSTTRRFGGTGLGLPISARLVGLMGGRLQVESQVGRGSTFHFDVSLALGRQTGAAVRPEAPLLEGVRVLVVDDNATNRHILQRSLEAWRMVALSAPDAASALTTLRRAAADGAPPRLLLVDMVMPDTDGLGLAARVRREPGFEDVPIILLTSCGMAPAPALRRELALSDFLSKPIKQIDLRASIVSALRPAVAPVDRGTGGAVSRVRDGRGPDAPLRILLAEDNPVNVLVARSMLGKWGETATVVSNGREVLDALAHGSFDVILMDCQMPEMDGFEAAGHVRDMERRSGDHVTIVALTAQALKGDREACLAAGMDDYLAKPLRMDELRAALERVRKKVSAAAVIEPNSSLRS